MVILSVRPSVRLSLLVSRPGTITGSGEIFRVFTICQPRFSSISRQNFMPLDEGDPHERGEKGRPLR